MRANYPLLLLPSVIITLALAQWPALGQGTTEVKRPDRLSNLREVLTPPEWERIDRSVEQALTWLATQQQEDGSFPTRAQGQPAVTSLCVLAYLSAGHQPGEGRYGPAINRAIDFVLECQQADGLFSFMIPEAAHRHQGASHTATYNHAIAGLMLTEVYGQVSRERAAKVDPAVRLALTVSKRQQEVPPKTDPKDKGGWRYMYAIDTSRSDLSVTGWQLMFLRSAKNAQFDIPDQMVQDAVAYVESLYQPERGEFFYGHSTAYNNDRYASRGVMGAGALSLALAGKHDTAMARKVGDWLLARPFDTYGATMHRYDRFHYSAYYCSNAMAQLGGAYWQKFFPTLAKTLVDAQAPDGSWLAESGEDRAYGSCYPTALSVLTLTPAYQLLPIYQR